MTQPAPIKLSARDRQSSAEDRKLTALACPRCDVCDAPTRFVGLESKSGDERVDLCTYQCIACEHVQAGIVPRPNGHAA